MSQAVDNSIKSIYRDGSKHALDVVLLHTPLCWEGHCTPAQQKYPWQDAWNNLARIYKEGQRIMAIGVSQFSYSQLNELIRLSDVRVAVVQNWMDPFHQDRDVSLLLLLLLSLIFVSCQFY